MTIWNTIVIKEKCFLAWRLGQKSTWAAKCSCEGARNILAIASVCGKEMGAGDGVHIQWTGWGKEIEAAAAAGKTTEKQSVKGFLCRAITVPFCKEWQLLQVEREKHTVIRVMFWKDNWWLHEGQTTKETDWRPAGVCTVITAMLSENASTIDL